jgi:hypothetical protein
VQTQAIIVHLLSKTIHPATAGVEDGEVVGKLDITDLNVELDGVLVGNPLQGVKSLPLGRGEDVGFFEDAAHKLAENAAVTLEDHGGVGGPRLVVTARCLVGIQGIRH